MLHKESMQMLRNRTDEVIKMMDVPLAKSDARSRTSPGLAAKPTGVDGDIGITLQTRLQSVKHLRLQIEDLARKHKQCLAQAACVFGKYHQIQHGNFD